MKNNFYNFYLILFFTLTISAAFGQDNQEYQYQEIEEKSRKDKMAAAQKVNSSGLALKNTDTTWTWLSAQWITLGGNAQDKFDWLEAEDDQHSFNAQVQLFLYYQNRNRKFRWENQFETGISYLQKGEIDPGTYAGDKLNFLTKVSYRISKKSKFSYSALFNMNTTFLERADAKGNVTKGFMEPGSIEFGPGINYRNNPGSLSIFGSPFTKKTIYVIGMGEEYNQLKQKEKIFYDETEYREFGFLVNATIIKDLSKSISYTGNWDFFSDYLHNPENIFINMRNLVRFKLGKDLALTWALNFIYDDHVWEGPQFKSEIGLTFSPKIQTKTPTKPRPKK